MRLVIPQALHEPMTALVKSVPFAYRGLPKASSSGPLNTLRFLRAESPPIDHKARERMSPPIFPRKRESGKRLVDAPSIDRMADVQTFMQGPGVKIEIDSSTEKDELAAANLVIVGGWREFAVPFSTNPQCF